MDWSIMGQWKQQAKSRGVSYLGQYFIYERRNQGRQKSCGKSECREKRKDEAQRRWLAKNPGYFQGRTENTRAWRAAHPGYQKAWRQQKKREIQDALEVKKPIKTIRFRVPVRELHFEIQDSFLWQVKVVQGPGVHGEGPRYKTAWT